MSSTVMYLKKVNFGANLTIFAGTPQETWANGTFRMTAQDMDSLYHANLYINIGTLNNDRQLRGRIVQNLISPAQELSKRPILLQSRNVCYIIHKSANLRLFL